MEMELTTADCDKYASARSSSMSRPKGAWSAGSRSTAMRGADDAETDRKGDGDTDKHSNIRRSMQRMDLNCKEGLGEDDEDDGNASQE